MRCESLAAHRAARFVERNTVRTRGQFVGELLGFVLHARVQCRGTRGLDDDETQLGKSELGCEHTSALAIEFAERLFGCLTRTADSRDRETHEYPLSGRADAFGLLRPGTVFTDRPHALEIVVAANFRAEEMDDHIAGVDQGPIALRQALDPNAGQAPLLQLAREVLGERRDMARRTSRCDDDGIAQRRPAAEVDLDDVFRLVVVEGGEDAREKGRFGRWRFFIATQLYAGRAAQGSAPSRGWSRCGPASSKDRNSWRFPICAAAEPFLRLRI